ncbi:MAG: NAD+ synthase [Nitrospiraceae bacterium]|nr:NAD+ synthase [Nitrospiraceae bacterium]MDA8433857.1 NAD+ synthase [Nitrospiraceae bacterium]
MNTLRLALAQINPTVGDLSGNAEKILGYVRKARRARADIAVFPELALTGYPPEDLVLKPQFISDNIAAMKKISRAISGIAVVAGFVDRGKNNEIYNAAAVIAEGEIVDVYHKVLLPNYGVFDEFRYFTPGRRSPVYRFGRMKLGINICEDVWHRDGPACRQSAAGAECIININASPYEKGKPETRERVLFDRSTENEVIIAYVNTVGGQDELVFDGMSMVVDHKGQVIARGRQFNEEMMVVDLDLQQVRRYRKEKARPAKGTPPQFAGRAGLIALPCPEPRPRKTIVATLELRLKKDEEIYGALVLGTSDYVRKNGFHGVVIGLSGGVDSSLVAAIAVDAIGKENVHGLFMPSEFTSDESREDAFALAANLGMQITEVPIAPVLREYLKVLGPLFRGREPDITEENLQARIRGNFLMALSNKFGWIVLTTGNKSEMSVGYATLYGDMAGGFAVIKDVPKTLVYSLCKWRNSIGEAVIPGRVLWKEPTAELKPDQKDTDTLPPYHLLDPVLKAYIEEELSFGEILKLGCDEETVRKVVRMVDRSEYKRRQSPPGIKITARAFGRDRRFPITNRYRSY